jgi:antitoxin ChpS
MYTTKLRKVDGSVMMALPPTILDMLQPRAGATVGITVGDGRLVIEAKPRPHYTLAELLAASDYSEPQPDEQREWADAPAVGRELL